jgi:prepilin-type N-terminal cleavage/methylation domain-containing protein
MKRLETRAASACHRSGFTLLELMLSIGLTSILMAAVYGAMSAYWNLALDSHEEVERTQIARALLTMLADDIQSCTFVEQTDNSQSDSDEGDDSDAAGTTDIDTSAYKNGLIGTERDLVLYISHPDSSLNYVTATEAVGTQERNSDLLIVRWLLADSAAGGLSAAIAQQHLGAGSGNIAGIARGSGGVTGFGNAIEQNDIALLTESTELTAAEVENLRFEYFDGIEWQSEWNSSTCNAMPQAIRIELTLRNPDSDGTPSPRDLPSTKHQLVVRIPVAAPYIEESAI